MDTKAPHSATAHLSITTLDPDSKDGFFKTFPRELRDEIYSRLYQEINYKTTSCVARVTSSIPQLGLLSRQFELEYEEKCQKSKHMNRLLITDVKPFRSNAWQLCNLAKVAAHATDMVIVLDCCSFNRAIELCGFLVAGIRPFECHLDLYRRWLHEAVGNFRFLPHRVYLEVTEEKYLEASLRFLEEVPPGVQEVKVLHPGRDWIEDGDKKVIATWTLARGLEQDDEAIKQCLDRVAAEQRLSTAVH